MKDKETKKINVAFNAIEPWLDDYEVKPIEKEINGKPFVSWGGHNEYPNFLHDLYENVSSLHSTISSLVDYICGNDVKSHNIYISDAQMREIVEKAAYNYALYGNVAINVMRNKLGDVCKLDVLDARDVRSDKKNTFFYYSEDWSKSYGRIKYLTLPKYDKDVKENTSIYIIKNSYYSTYGSPMWISAVRAAMMEDAISDFQINSIKNGFQPSVMLNFCNGQPDEETKEEIENAVYDKFTGAENAGRPLINFCEDKDHALDVQKIDTEDFSDRYESAAKRAKEEIFSAFRINQNLVGINLENIGFNSQEFDSAFALANRTVVRPIQQKIVNAINDILGTDAVEIKPFSLNIDEDDNNNTDKEETVD